MKLFVWDFNGTLEKGTEKSVIKITNEVLKKFSYSRIMTAEECDLLWGKKWVDFFRFLLPSEPEEKLMELQQECFRLSDIQWQEFEHNIKPVPHAKDVLDAIAKKHEQIVISNIRTTNIRNFLDAAGIGAYFPDGNAIAIDSHTYPNRTKASALKEFLEGKGFEKVVVIGDTPEDINMSSVIEDLGIPAVSYLYAHPQKDFLDCDADYKIRDLREVLREV